MGTNIPGGYSENINKLLRGTSAGQIAQQLDAQDGKLDGKIDKSVWNTFVQDKGGKQIQNFITTENAMKSITTYAVRNAAKTQGDNKKTANDLGNSWLKAITTPQEQKEVRKSPEVPTENTKLTEALQKAGFTQAELTALGFDATLGEDNTIKYTKKGSEEAVTIDDIKNAKTQKIEQALTGITTEELSALGIKAEVTADGIKFTNKDNQPIEADKLKDAKNAFIQEKLPEGTTVKDLEALGITANIKDANTIEYTIGENKINNLDGQLKELKERKINDAINKTGIKPEVLEELGIAAEFTDGEVKFKQNNKDITPDGINTEIAKKTPTGKIIEREIDGAKGKICYKDGVAYEVTENNLIGRQLIRDHRAGNDVFYPVANGVDNVEVDNKKVGNTKVPTYQTTDDDGNTHTYQLVKNENTGLYEQGAEIYKVNGKWTTEKPATIETVADVPDGKKVETPQIEQQSQTTATNIEPTYNGEYITNMADVLSAQYPNATISHDEYGILIIKGNTEQVFGNTQNEYQKALRFLGGQE